MAANSLVLLNRLLSLKESTPFLLVLDTVAQSSFGLLQEVVHRSQAPEIIFLSFETANAPAYATTTIDCECLAPAVIVERVRAALSAEARTLIIVDSLNYLPAEELSAFLSGITAPTACVVGVYHTTAPRLEPATVGYPAPVSFLSYIASAVFEVHPLENDTNLEMAVERLTLPVRVGLNLSSFRLEMASRRKSGRSLTHSFTLNTLTHEAHVREEAAPSEEEPVDLDWTTFNLSTNKKQQQARDQVELPFLEAQTFGSGGAIVYEFDKDDDYDAEDPFEDPF